MQDIRDRSNPFALDMQRCSPCLEDVVRVGRTRFDGSSSCEMTLRLPAIVLQPTLPTQTTVCEWRRSGEGSKASLLFPSLSISRSPASIVSHACISLSVSPSHSFHSSLFRLGDATAHTHLTTSTVLQWASIVIVAASARTRIRRRNRA